MIDPRRTPEALRQRFERFALACLPTSPLYNSLSLSIAEDAEMLELASHFPSDQPAPNLLFGAVHLLLLQGQEHPLFSYYPSLGGTQSAVEETFPLFKEFCLKYREAILVIMGVRSVQTN